MNVYKAIKQECEGLEMCLKKERGGSIIALRLGTVASEVKVGEEELLDGY